MARYKPQDRNSLLLPVVLSEQIVPGSFAFALDYLIDNELNLSALDAQFNNDKVGASAYDPRVMLKIVLLAYSRGLISSRTIEQACQRNVQCIAIRGDSQPSHTHIAKSVANVSGQIKPLFSQVLMTCDAQGPIGRDMFAIDGVKLLALHRAQDKQGANRTLEPKRQSQMQALHKEAARTREFLARNAQRKNRMGQELKTNITDPESAKMATSKGVIQGYAAQAAVNSSHQVIVAADVIGSGSEQTMLLPMIEQSKPYREDHTLIRADAGYHSDANGQYLKDHNIPTLIAGNQVRNRDERFENQGKYKDKNDLASCSGAKIRHTLRMTKKASKKDRGDSKARLSLAGNWVFLRPR